MTDNEMIELLLNDVAARHSYFLCFDKENKSHIICTIDICDFIIRLMTENKKLKDDLEWLNGQYLIQDMHIQTVRGDAVKEFAKRLKSHYDQYDDYDDIYAHHIRDDIDFTLDDMVRNTERKKLEDEKDTRRDLWDEGNLV